MRNHQYAILDLRGLMLHAYYAGMTPEPIYGTVKETINTASYGFTTFLNMVYDQIVSTIESPINMIAVVEGGKLYRKNLYKDYKANRDKQERDPLESAEIEKLESYIKTFLASQGVPICRVAGVEADDVIAYLVQKLHGQKVVYTVDQDLIALASDVCTVMYRLNPVYDMKGIPPECVTINKALVGDTSDNYPGVKGLGPKAWDSLVESFGYDGMVQLGELLQKMDRHTLLAIGKQTDNKAYHKAISDLEHLFLMYKLARLAPELCTGAKVKIEWYKRAPTKERLHSVMTKAGCMDLAHRYEDDCYTATLVTTDNLDEVFTKINQLTPETPFVAWDYETWDPVKNPKYTEAANGREYVDMLNSKVAGCSFAVGRNANHVYYLSTGHKDTKNVSADTVLQVIKHFEEEDIPMVAQNVAFEATITKTNFDHDLKFWEDTKLYAHHLDENDEVGLKHLSKRYLNYDQVSYKKTLEAAGAKDMSEISGVDVLSYGADDSLVTAHLYQHFTILSQLEGTSDFIQKYECPAVKILTDAHRTGVKLDVEEMARQKAADEETYTNTMCRIRELLNENALQPNFSAIDVLYDDQKAYISYKAKDTLKTKKPDASPTELQDAVATALADYKQKLKENSYYQPLVSSKSFKPFLNTIVGINNVLAYLGLPALDSIGKEALSDYVKDHNIASAQPEFTKVLLDALNDQGKGFNNWRARTGEKYQALADFCNKILEENGKDVFTGTELNLGSPVQKQYLFYLLLGLPIRKRTKVTKDSLRDKGGFMGSPATDESAIYFALANDCTTAPWKKELLETLMKHTESSTRLSNYWKPYPLWLDENHIMHPGFSSCGTVTRRPTGTNPNLLQVSKGAVRDVFIPRSSDRVIVSIDYSSQELRIMASECQDPTFLRAYQGETDLDLHALTGCGIAPSQLKKLAADISMVLMDTPDLVNYDYFKAHQDDEDPIGKALKKSRSYAKTANFGCIYGSGPATMSEQLMIPLEEAEDIIESMSRTYPGINKWKAVVCDQAKLSGYTRTAFGSYRHVGNNLLVGTTKEKSRWERQICNYRIQGCAADLAKVAMWKIIESGVLEKYSATVIAVVYDEVVFEAPIDGLCGFLNEASSCMEQPIPGELVPMKADCSFGPSWGKQYEVGVHPTQEAVDAAIAKMLTEKGVQ